MRMVLASDLESLPLRVLRLMTEDLDGPWFIQVTWKEASATHITAGYLADLTVERLTLSVRDADPLSALIPISLDLIEEVLVP